MSSAEMRKIRGNRISMIFQEPMTSLNPVFTIGTQIIEAVRTHTKMDQSKAREIGYPIIVKPIGGGGGIGMTIATTEEELQNTIESSRATASASFGLPDVYN
jgi:ABC-type dipeptide/oligopeptide/nickel transport system ATPase component